MIVTGDKANLIYSQLQKESNNYLRAVHAAGVAMLAGSIRRGENEHADGELKNTSLLGAQLSGVDLTVWPVKGGADLYLADLSGARMGNATLVGSYFGWANLDGTNCSFADLSRSDFSMASMRGVILTRTSLASANLFSCDLRGIDGLKASGTDLTDASIVNCRFDPLKMPPRRRAAHGPAWRDKATAVAKAVLPAVEKLRGSTLRWAAEREGRLATEVRQALSVSDASLERRLHASLTAHLIDPLFKEELPKLAAELQTAVLGADAGGKAMAIPRADAPVAVMGAGAAASGHAAARVYPADADDAPASSSDSDHAESPGDGALAGLVRTLLAALLSELRTSVEAEASALVTLVVKEREALNQQWAGADEEKAGAQLSAAAIVQRLGSALDRGVQRQVQAALFGRASGVLGAMKGAARPMHELASGLDKLESRLAAALTSAKMDADGLLSRYAPKGSLRGRLARGALARATMYTVRVGPWSGSMDMLGLAWRRSRVELSKDETELTYLLEKLAKIEDEKTSDATWKDVCESWQALLKLRSQINVERGQIVLECILSDPAVLSALGAADALLLTRGTAPTALLTMLNQGPGAHIRGSAFRYRRMLERELVRIRRVKELQWRAVTLTGSAIVASMIGVANFISRLLYDLSFPAETVV